MDSSKADVALGDGRDETAAERLDRNWDEILQELRVTQTGSQIITGFLLTLAFQSRFTDLDPFQVGAYLVLVVLAAATTALGLAPVSLHRTLFRQKAKEPLVRIANRVLKTVLVGVACVLAGTVLLIFDVVVGRAAGIVAGSLALLAMVGIALALPLLARRSMRANPTDAAPGSPRG
ncbi:MAG: sodium:proton antiporter [Burkholderiaceae bacterium]|nr:sodium:proton antiporter [Microbacteriaceae bacterium]